MPTRLKICQKCEFRQRPCGGSCICLADDKALDIIGRAEANDCPKDFFKYATEENNSSITSVTTSIRGDTGFDGSKLWEALHTDPEGSPELVSRISILIPCGICSHHWTMYRIEHPPVFGSGWFEWTVNAHNAVSRRIGKPEMSLQEAAIKWGRTIANAH